MNRVVPKLLLISTLLGTNLFASTCHAQAITDKLEYQGSSKYVVVSGLMARERGGITTLQIELTNPDNLPRKIYWRIKWLDESGFQVWDDEPWKPVLVQGSAKQNLLANSPTVKARDFRIQFNAENNYWNTAPASPEPQSN